MKFCDIFLLAIIGGCLLSLCGCTDRHEQPLSVTGAPALRTWSPEEECALAQILGDYPAESVVWTLHDDWARMRREVGVIPAKIKNHCTQEKPTRPTFLS